MARSKETSVQERGETANNAEELFASAADSADDNIGIDEPTDSEEAELADVGTEEESGVGDVELERAGEAQEQSQQVEEKTFTLWDGTKVSVSQLASNPDLLERVVLTANQAPHLQRKYVELLEQQRSLFPQSQEQHRAQREEEPRPKTREELLEEYNKVTESYVNDLVKSGLLSEETVALAPDLARVAARIVDRMIQLSSENQRLSQIIDNYVMPILTQATQAGETMLMNSVSSELMSRIDNLVRQKPQLASFFDEETKSKVVKTLVEQYGPDVLQYDEQFLVGSLLAQKPDLILDALSRQSNTAVSKRAEQVRTAVGEKSSPKGGRTANQDIISLFSGG